MVTEGAPDRREMRAHRLLRRGLGRHRTESCLDGRGTCSGSTARREHCPTDAELSHAGHTEVLALGAPGMAVIIETGRYGGRAHGRQPTRGRPPATGWTLRECLGVGTVAVIAVLLTLLIIWAAATLSQPGRHQGVSQYSQREQLAVVFGSIPLTGVPTRVSLVADRPNR